MRRLVGALLLCALVTGCSSAPAETAGPSTPVETMFGVVEVPANPQRVVALGWGDAEAALALGVQPVAASDWQAYGGVGVGPSAADRYTTPPTVLGTLQVDPEAVAALDPDVILWTRSNNDQGLYETFSRIAPTVAPPPGTTRAYGTLYDEQTRLVAAALGRPEQGEELISGVERQFADVRAAHPGWAGEEVAVGVYNAGQFAAYVNGGARADFMADLGFTLKPEINELPAEAFSAPLGTENVSALDADLTVLFLLAATGDEVRANPLVQQLESTKAGRLLVLDDKSVSKSLSSGTVLGTRYAIETVVPLVEATQV